MEQKKISKPYSPEFRERAVRLFLEHGAEYRSESAAFAAISGKLLKSSKSKAVKSVAGAALRERQKSTRKGR